MQERSNDRFNELLLEGIAATKDHNYTRAEYYLSKAAEASPQDARPWLWLTETTEDLDKKIDYMESAVAADPSHSAARRGLAILKGKINPEELFKTEEEVQPKPEQSEPEKASTIETYECPNCGAQIKFSVEDLTMVCGHCGFTKKTENHPAAQQEAQVLDFVLPTQKGHSWADTQVRLTCENCGATSLWPPGQTSIECPFCLSSHLVETPSTSEVIDPSAIGLFKLDETNARRILQEWFQKGLTVPDDLVNLVQKTKLNPAYFPFWAIDGTLEFKWHCEINEGSSNNPNWIQRSGTEYEIFDRILVSGSKKIPAETLKKLGDFEIKDLLDFQPEYLAGWPAITYEIPLSEASLSVREQVTKKVRKELYRRIEPHQEKKNLRTGTLNWRDMSFKLVYLPIYTGLYHYRGKNYHLFINGITGKISGEKPRNPTKFYALVLTIVLSVVLLIAIGLIILSFMGVF